MPVIFSDHAKEKLRFRHMSEKVALAVVQKPTKVLPSSRGRKLRQRKVSGFC